MHVAEFTLHTKPGHFDEVAKDAPRFRGGVPQRSPGAPDRARRR